jgi:ABC-type branched-subunit amino acid transport system substrate-binding protein
VGPYPELLDEVAILLLSSQGGDLSRSDVQLVTVGGDHRKGEDVERDKGWWRLAALLTALLLIAGGCSSGGDSEEDASSENENGGGEIATDIGVTEEPCPDAVNEDNGCIYLGTLSDLTIGPFAPLAVPITDAQAAFWNRVNEEGGIGGAYDVDATTYVEDNEYNPEVQVKKYQQIEPEILALAQTLGTPPTLATLDLFKQADVVGAPASWWSGWEFEDNILESGSNYCLESMNAIDYAIEEFGVENVMAVGYPGDYGGDAAAGAEIAAQENGLEFLGAVETAPNAVAGSQEEAIGAVLEASPDLVIITTGPTEMAEIVGGTAARNFEGKFIGTSPTWNKGVLESAADTAIEALYLQSSPWPPFGADTPGHEAMRAAVGEVDPNDGYTSGWVWSYPLRQVLENAYENGDLTRAGVVQAATELETVDYEGMLPDDAGSFSGDPNDTVFRQIVINKPDRKAPSGVTTVEDFFVGPTAEGFDFAEPCQAAE